MVRVKKKQGKREEDCEYAEDDIIDETESGANILKLLLHPCVLPFEVQNKLLFYLDSDEINILTKDRIKAKEGFEAGPQFNIYDHTIDPIKNLLRLKPGDAASSKIEEIYKKAEKPYLKEIEKAGESTDSNAYIKDDKGFIHKFKLNMKTCVDHAKAKNTNENDPTESQENLFFSGLEDVRMKTEESQGVSNAPVQEAGKTEKILQQT